MSKIYELKMSLKEMASEIKKGRIEARLLKQNGKGPAAHLIHNELMFNSLEFRCYHIAYCELRGRTRDQIEKPRKDNIPNQKTIDRIKKMYKEEVIYEEALCIGQN